MTRKDYRLLRMMTMGTHFACNECGERLTKKNMKNLPDGTLLCPECFDWLMQESE